MPRFTFYDYFLAFISTCTYIADVATDIALIVYFYTEGHQVWGSLSLCFVAVAALLMQVFSFHWHVTDKTLTIGSLFVHLLFLAPLHRYFKVFQLGRKSVKSGNGEDLGAAYRAINDISILRLVETFLESAPQLVLQLYIVLSNLENFNALLGFSMVFSLFSVSWSITAYTDALHLAYKKFYKRSFVSMITHLIWQTGMVMARVVSIVLFATVFHGYVGIPLGVHFVVMLVWIMKLQPEFGTTPCERRLFTVVAAAIHIFCFLNLKDGNSRYRMVFYYVLALIETAAYMTVWYLCKSYSGPIWFDVTAFSVVFGSFGLGTIFMLLYYGCCHPSGPAPIPSQKPDFLKPGNLTFGAPTYQYEPSMISKKPQQNKQMKNPAPSKGNHPSIFDVSSTSARINLWLSASLDLSKEGLVEDPDSHLDPSLQMMGNHQTTNNQDMTRDISMQRKVSDIKTPVDVHVSPLGSSGSYSAAKPLLGKSNYQEHGSYRERSASELNRMEDRMDFSKISAASDREQSLPDYNLVEMFARCKLDPSFVSNSSISDIFFNQTLKQNTPTSRNGKFSILPENLYGKTLLEQNKSEMNISGSNWNQTRTSDDSSKSLIYSPKMSPDLAVRGELGPPSISPLDPSRLWEESEGRLGLTSSLNHFMNNTGSDPTLHQSGEKNPVLTVTPDESRGITHLSLSYSNLNSDSISPRQNNISSRDNSGLSETANSFAFKKGVDKSIESLSNSSNLVNQSEMLSFSDVSLQLPDCSSNSRDRSETQPDVNQSSTPSLRGDIHKRKRSKGYYDSLKNSSLDKFSKSRSKDSFSSREYSPSDRQSSYLSDRGLASSDRGLSSSHSTNDASGHRSLTSSGFQSEESNMSTTSPAYSHFSSKNASKFHSTPVVENEISSICPPSSVKPISGKRDSLDDDIYADVSKFKNSTPMTDETNFYDHGSKDNITPITSMEPKKGKVIMPPSSLFYENSQTHSPVLPPIGWSRCSSTGSSSSGGRFFKDPTLSSNEDLNSKSEGESKFTSSLVSQGTNSGYMEKSSLSALLSDMSSSKCTRTSEETFSVASDPDPQKMSNCLSLSENVIRKAGSLPYMPENNSDNHLTASLPYQFYNSQQRRSLDKSQSSIHDYENIYNDTKRISDASNSSSLNMSGSKMVSAYLYNSELEKNRLQELYDEYSHASCGKNESENNKTFNKNNVPVYENVNDFNDCNTEESDPRSDMFSRDKWRASLDKEMKERLVHDIEKLAPKKLYQLSTKNGVPKRKMSPVNITEYTDSPYKFRKPYNTGASSEYENIDSLGQTHLSQYTESPFKVRKSGNTARRTIYGNMETGSKDSLTTEYENINFLSNDTNYININHLLGPCPVATPESLSDTVMLDDIHGQLGRGDKTFNLVNNKHCELYQDPMFENESLRSHELLRTKSPINTTGFNSAFKPVQRKSVESPLSRTSSGSDKTYNIENEIEYKTDEFVHSNKMGAVESTDSSVNSGKGSRRQSNVSNYVSDVENMSSFQWTRDTGMLSMTGLSNSVSRSPRNYLQLAGKAPLNFSVPTFLQDDSSSQTSKHSYTDSIPWEESDNSLQTTADLSEGKLGTRQPLKALENTPVFSPIYGQDRRLSIELSSRKRFMSTPKLSTGSEMSVSRISEESKTPQRRRSSGISKKAYSDNTSTWSTQSETDISCNNSEHSTFGLSKTTYI